MKNISFKKIGLVIKNNYIINRSVPIILFIVLFVLGSIIGAMPISDIESRYSYRIAMDLSTYEYYTHAMESTYNDLIGTDSVFSLVYIVAALVLAFLSVLSLNGFMRDKSSNDFYHSLYINRGEIYIANFITAFINSAVTIVISQLGGLLFMNFIASYKPMTLWQMLAEQLPVILTVLLFLALFIALAMLATIASGSVFAGIINYACLNFLAPATVLAVAVSGDVLFGSNLMNYLEHFPWAYCYTSPFIRYIYSAMGYLELTPVSYIILALAVLALVILGIWIYSLKKNENALKPLPFAKMVRPLQYVLTFDAILLGATFFEAITSSAVWCFIGALLALFFAFIAFNAFVDKSFNSVFKRSRHMLFIFIATLVVGAIFVADIFGIYKNPTPNYDEIESCYMNISINYDDREEWVSYDFVEEIDEYNKDYSIEIDDNLKLKLAKLYQLIEEESDKNRMYTEGTTYMSISMGIDCEGDFSRYHTYVYLPDSSESWNEIEEIITSIKENYRVSDTNIYYYEK